MSAAKRILDILLAGRLPDRYAYGCVPLREEVTNKLEDGQGNTVAVVTRNLYGSLVLNTERVMFVGLETRTQLVFGSGTNAWPNRTTSCVPVPDPRVLCPPIFTGGMHML
jgi:hypothetical protein